MEVPLDPSSSLPEQHKNDDLTENQRSRIQRNKELAVERLKKRREEEAFEKDLAAEGELTKEGRRGSSDNTFGGFAFVDNDTGGPSSCSPKKRRKLETKESQVLSDTKSVCHQGSVVRIQGTKLVDTGGGFLIEEGDLLEEEEEEKVLTVPPAAIVPSDAPTCQECGASILDSYLLNQFDLPVCDTCKDTEEKHKLITKTDARNQYLLKDVDLDKREPVLKFICRPNPHNNRWGDMKLYLRLQVEKRAMEIWGSLEAIEEQIKVREENRAKSKVKKYGRKMESLRMSARSSLYTKDLGPHQHTWGPDESLGEDEYRHVCLDCGQEETFEKM